MPISSQAFTRRTIAFLTLGFLTVAGIMGAALYFTDRAERGLTELSLALQLQREASALTADLRNTQIGQLGYLLTQEERYLEPFVGAVVRIRGALDRMREKAIGLPFYADALQQLQEKVNAKLSELDRTITLAQENRLAEAQAIISAEASRESTAAITDITKTLIADINLRIAAITAKTSATATLLYQILVVGGLTILLIVAAKAWTTWRYTAQLERAQRELTALNLTLEERVRHRAGALARANEEIQRFAYIVSHDLRSPLVNIMGFTSELEAGLGTVRSHVGEIAADTAELQELKHAIETDMPESIEFIRASTGRMDGLINAILKMSREGRRRLTAEDVDMQELLETAAASVRHQIDAKDGEIRVETPLPAIRSDKVALEQVFGNLIDNAAKYLDESRPPEIVVRGRPIRTGVEFEVQDNGRGIAPEDHERIFDLFRRSGAQDQPGEGIGLFHVRALVRRLGGDIEVKSELGKGTVFRVSLPENMPLLQENSEP